MWESGEVAFSSASLPGEVKQLPQHIPAEQSVLGAMLTDSHALTKALQMLKPDDFYYPAHRTIFEAMSALHSKDQPVDVVTLSAELLTKNNSLDSVGGIAYIAELAASMPTALHIEHHSQIVKEKSTLRRILLIATEVQAQCFDGTMDSSAILASAERKFVAIASEQSKKEFSHISDSVEHVMDKIHETAVSEEKLTGVATGFVDLDSITNGLQKQDLIIVAARPSVGKTAFALNMGQNVATKSKVPVAIFSLEMSRDQLTMRMLSAESTIEGESLKKATIGDDEWVKLNFGANSLAHAPIFIDDSPGITLNEIRSKLRKLKMSEGLGLVVIDYLQLIQPSGRGGTREQEISEISRGLKQLARELDVPIIALAQLSRGVEQRSDKRPMLSDIRESGSIEQDADIVAFLYRDDYYNKETENKDRIEIILAKHRNGAVGTVELGFLKNYNKFVNLSSIVREQESA